MPAQLVFGESESKNARRICLGIYTLSRIKSIRNDFKVLQRSRVSLLLGHRRLSTSYAIEFMHKL